MANSFTPEELKALEDAKKPPEGYEAIPDEHRARYIMMAVEQIGMVLVTISTIFFQVSRSGDAFLSDNGKIEGCAAGLMRAIWFLRGYRNTASIGENANKKLTT
jgi:hypothetical protein